MAPPKVYMGWSALQANWTWYEQDFAYEGKFLALAIAETLLKIHGFFPFVWYV